MRAILQAIWLSNPIRVMTSVAVIIQAGFVVATAFGYALTATQQAAITGFLAVVIGEISRSQVIPVRSLAPQIQVGPPMKGPS